MPLVPPVMRATLPVRDILVAVEREVLSLCVGGGIVGYLIAFSIGGANGEDIVKPLELLPVHL